ncbi:MULTISPECIES: phosphoribosylanthranilate isomerase [Myroides]|uniref:N-(5'-phosphoribosyl)anthranilate isomerase n=1 Tax=Myroides albus TaxID=2562892 RepID=A0A6I3LB79_9FLAO|nr:MULTISPECIES: phosphoribosylanthranilate isomerase [Myroides]MTG96699.1 phosphoribosylanthranilate isomerase [Myroides albus]MVX34711.1 phosphoribosylanthranilate isomerase [Myroides sp. LoEW2-1]UVD80889.1 phosphoribosylanthranilate isomerase [Myroides albus]
MNQVKVCGLKYKENIQELTSLPIDYMGFIFYPSSKRYAGNLDTTLLSDIPSTIKKVGVFVNAKLSEIQDIVTLYCLDYIQLHGAETVEDCNYFYQQNIPIIKAFAITDTFDFKQTAPYEKYCSLFVFDTACKQYGGSGKSFDWTILQSYNGKTPFLLSGGLGLQNIKEALKITHKQLIGFDLNSQLETEIALKDCKQIQTITNIIKHETL